MWKYIKKLPLFTYQNGRHTLSLWVSRLVERLPFKRVLGIQLVAALVFTGIVTPQATDMYTRYIVDSYTTSSSPLLATTITKPAFFTPLTQFRISQRFSFWHQGIDMTASLGTPVYSVGDGVVEYADYGFFGYGNHVIISHPHGNKSLYGHLSLIGTAVGKEVKQGEEIGKVGSTGWSTGNHLHLEIYHEGSAINPLEVLPVNVESIAFEATAFSASPSAIATPPAQLSSVTQ